MKKLNIGILYAGEHAHRNIIPALINNKKYLLKGIYSRSKKNYNSNLNYLYKNKTQIINNQNIDVIYVSSPNSKHYQNILEILDKNKHIICEKPLCINLSQYFKIKEKYKKKNRIVFEAFMFKYHSIFNYFLKVIKKKNNIIKKIGLKFTIPHKDKKDIRYNKSLGGGAYYDCGCYLFKFLSSISNKENTKYKKIRFKFSKKFRIDTYGVLNTQINKMKVNLEWGLGLKYENNIVIEFKDKKIASADRFFSKNFNETPTIKIYDQKKAGIKLKKFQKQNHFFNMFEYFYKLKNNKKMRENYQTELENHQLLYLKKLPYKIKV